MQKRILATLALLLPLSIMLPAFSANEHSADIINAQGKSVGQATLEQTPHGVLVHANVHSLSPGWHAFHVHQVGTCTPPNFKSAGGHFNPTSKEHGYENPKGFHMGDMPNIYVSKKGTAQVDFLVQNATLDDGPNGLLDKDGSSIVIHAGKDDYKTNPAGNAGDRVGCGVIK